MNSETVQLAPLLAEHFTVFHYDRRGRGESTDTQPYAAQREIEDIEALITEAGGLAFVFGISSGAALALEAAIKLGNKVKKLAMYEVPYNSDEAARHAWKAYRKLLADPIEKVVGVAVPTLIMDGSTSYPFMHITATALAGALPNAEHRTQEGASKKIRKEIFRGLPVPQTGSPNPGKGLAALCNPADG